MKNSTLFFIVSLLLVAFGFQIGMRVCTGFDKPGMPQVDTVFVQDTIVSEVSKEKAIPKGYELTRTSDIRSYQRQLAEYRDSLGRKPMLVEVHDTTYIAVPIQEHTFTDGSTYKFSVSGYAVKFLRHESYQDTKIVRRYVASPPKFAFSPFMRSLYSYDRLDVVAGLKLDIWQGKWQFSPSVGYGLNVNRSGYSHGMVAGFEIDYNLIRR